MTESMSARGEQRRLYWIALACAAVALGLSLWVTLLSGESLWLSWALLAIVTGNAAVGAFHLDTRYPRLSRGWHLTVLPASIGITILLVRDLAR